MLEVNLNKLKEVVAAPYNEEHFVPLVLFRGNCTIGRAKSLWNFVQALMIAEVPNTTEALRLGTESHDLIHLCGLHRPLQSMGLYGFLSRLWLCPDVMERTPGLAEYVTSIKSRHTFFLEPISRYTHHSHVQRAWRKSPKRLPSKETHINVPIPHDAPPMPSFYPFISGEARDEHELILAVHKVVPQGLPKQHREDICQDLLVGILMGDVKLENVQDSLEPFIRKVFKQFPTKYGPLSLDRPFSADDERTLAEMLSEDSIRAHW